MAAALTFFFLHWLTHVMGIDDVSGRWYGFWSGFGSDISELILLGGVCAFLRKHNCHVRRCWRIGRHVTAAGHWTCAHHSPAGAPTHEEVIAAHEAASRARGDQP